MTEREGHVDKYIGDNVMAVFGAPVAHEDDPERAVQGGPGDAGGDERDQRRDRAAGRRRSDVELALRVGINSGEVLAGRMGDQYTVIGDTVNVAARLQAASGIGRGHRRRRDPPADGGRDRVPRPRAARR